MLSVDWFKKTPEMSKINDVFPLVYMLDDNKTICAKNGELVQVMEILGKDYTGLEWEVLLNLTNLRQQFVESIPSTVHINQYSHRYELTDKAETNGFFNSDVSEEISAKWNKRFVSSYRTRHFLVFTTGTPATADQLANLLDGSSSETDLNSQKLINLNEVVEKTRIKLSEYAPRILEEDEHVSYWAWHLNGKHTYQSMPKNKIFNEDIAGVALEWPDNKKYQIYDDSTPIYSAWLSIKFFSDDPTTQSLVDKLFSVKKNFTLYQSFSVLDKAESMKTIQARFDNAASFMKGADIIEMELEEIQNRIQANEITLCEYTWSIQVFSKSIEGLDKAANKIADIPESYGIRVVREGINQEALFWAIFPTLNKLNSRKRVITSENIADLIAFASVGEGLNTCSWGDMPVTRFMTSTESEYSFTFHPTPERMALGHTLVIGGTGQGKTTLISFLIAMSTKYPNFKALLFDRAFGMFVMSKMLDGNYTDFTSGQSEINPFLLPDTPINRTFLNHWLTMLIGNSDDETMRDCQRVIDLAYSLPANERSIDNLADAFGLAEKGSARSAISKWLTGGSFGHFFTGKKDGLSFESQLVGFDMTTLLDIPEVLGPITDYIIHRLKSVATSADGGPFAVFLDEFPKYLDNKIFAPKVQELAFEIRKLNGVLILAAQDAKQLTRHELGSKIIDSMANYIIYPNPTADRSVYVDELGLSQGEFDWVKGSHTRQVLFHRRGGESIILDIDLSYLGDHLNVFDSSSDKVNLLRNLIKSTGDFKNEYIKSAKEL
jgi:type IV secretion/conjugal transfer VirB4 family ATPase